MCILYLRTFFGWGRYCQVSHSCHRLGVWRIYMISCFQGIKVPLHTIANIPEGKDTLEPEKASLGKNHKTWNNIYQHPSKTKWQNTRKQTITRSPAVFSILNCLKTNDIWSTSSWVCGPLPHFHPNKKRNVANRERTKWHWRARRKSSGVIALQWWWWFCRNAVPPGMV